MQCVILAGGLGTRMRPWTEATPKVLLPVAGRPFVDRQLEWLAAGGVDDVVLCVGHLGSAVHDHVGGGDRWGLRVRYSDEGEDLRGTAGALRLAYDAGLLAEQFLLTYGDSYLDVRIQDVWSEFRRGGAPALMTVFRNTGQWVPGNASACDGWITRYEKSQADEPEDLDFVDYGLLAFDRVVVPDRVPRAEVTDLSAVLRRLAAEGRLAAFEATRRFYEIGSRAGLRGLEDRLSAGSARRRSSE